MTDPTKSNIPRCAHKVYSPHGKPNGTGNGACSLCTPIKIGEKEIPKTLLVKTGGQWKNLAKKQSDESIAE